MTKQWTWTPSPQTVFELPETGKVTGRITLTWMGRGRVITSTERAHVNDTNPALDYRGESWLMHAFLVRSPEGEVTPSDRVHITRRANWTDATPGFRKPLLKAVCDLVADLTPQDFAGYDRAGEIAAVHQELSRDEDTMAQIDEQINDLTEQRAALVKRSLGRIIRLDEMTTQLIGD